MKIPVFLYLLLILSILVASCGRVTETPDLEPEPTSVVRPTATPVPTEILEATETPEQPLYLNLIWHQHQPLYYKDERGIYTRPWVRVHATKDYYDMASTVQQYPQVHVTFNLTPVLIRQLDDFALNDAKDRYWVLGEKDASALSDEEKRFILERFFDVNWDYIISRFPGYQALLNKRGGATSEEIDAAIQRFTEQDIRDLQVWFNLAWFDPDFLAREPLKSLVEKDGNFAEEDKAVIFDEARRIIREVIPLHKQLQDDGQIEIITTPYAHPILPLLYDTNLATVGNPSIELPSERFSYPNDAIRQLKLAVKVYESHFDQLPRGLWPSEGAVAEEIVPLVANAGFQWMATGEPVLAASLGIDSFTRDTKDTVQEADVLYRPYYVQGRDGLPVMIVFRDWVLSDKVGFTYSQTPGEQAAQDFIDRLENIRAQLDLEGAQGPHLVSVILDGENAWEYYENDGKAFLNALYRKLAESDTIKTLTPSEYQAMFPKQESLEQLFPGAWFSANFDTWIGEPEENLAWDYLREVREDLFQYDYLKKKTAPSPEALESALDFMYLAEGSDWFWWYGNDQDSGQDTYFDLGFRSLLAGVYQSLEEPIPNFINVPIIAEAPVEPSRQFSGLFTPTIDGRINPEDEWDTAAAYLATGGAMARAEDLAAGFYNGLDANSLYLRLDAKVDWSEMQDITIGFYLYSPRNVEVFPFTHLSQSAEKPNLIGFSATNLLEVRFENGVPQATAFIATPIGWQENEILPQIEMAANILELAVPLELLGELEPGDDLRLIAVISQRERDIQFLPSSGPAQLVVPDLGLTTILLSVQDAEGDDNGPGSYTYPTDAVFEKGVFDLKEFSVSYDDNNMVFKFAFYGPVPNPWGSPNNLAIQTLDIYVDKDPGAATGASVLLPGRNAALLEGNGWEYAVWAEGWTPSFVINDQGVPKTNSSVSFKIIADPASSTVTLRVPLEAFGDGDPMTWGYAAAVLSQDGFPSPGVWRVRDGQETAEQWRFGGVPAGATNYVRIFDIPDTGDQAQQLGFVPSENDPAELTADDFAQIQLLQAE